MCFTEQALCPRMARNKAPQRAQPTADSVQGERKILGSRLSSKFREYWPRTGHVGEGMGRNHAQIKDKQWSLVVDGLIYH